jgi:lipoyl(octanoyl) transferase
VSDTAIDLDGLAGAAPVGALSPVVRTLGRSDYDATWRAMRALTLARTATSRDEIWVTEHAPVYTVGLAGRVEHYPRGPTPVPVVRTDRGGQITYHGPGQAVVYTLVDLRRRGRGVRDYVRRLEDAMIRLLETHGISAYGKADAPGVYVKKAGLEAKIGALGLKVANGCTYHGVALNVAMDLSPFAAIDPCGYRGLAVTQLSDFGVSADVSEVGAALARCLVQSLR